MSGIHPKTQLTPVNYMPCIFSDSNWNLLFGWPGNSISFGLGQNHRIKTILPWSLDKIWKLSGSHVGSLGHFGFTSTTLFPLMAMRRDASYRKINKNIIGAPLSNQIFNMGMISGCFFILEKLQGKYFIKLPNNQYPSFYHLS